VPDEDEYIAIGRQFGRFYRRAERFHQALRVDVPGGRLDRAAYHVLAHVAATGPVRLSALAADLCVDLSTASRQVAALETAGLLGRTPDPADRRASLIEATGTGTRVVADYRATWLAAMNELLADWTADERREFARLFTRLNDALAATTTSDPHVEAAGNGPRAARTERPRAARTEKQ
jgi:DNA-binding MarR family transcriptional regulator